MARERGPEEQRGYLASSADPSNQHNPCAKVSHLGCCSAVKPQPTSHRAEKTSS